MIESFKRWRRARLRRKLRAKSARYKAVWAAKPDEAIIHAHKDAMGWIILERPGARIHPARLLLKSSTLPIRTPEPLMSATSDSLPWKNTPRT